jgi:hypothetical protein
MATKKTMKRVAKKAPTRRPKTKVAVHESIDAGATEAAAETKTAPAQRRQRVERDLPVGMVLKRQFKGKDVEVTVDEGGFEYEDQTFKSISAVARRITGYPQISGPAFFKLDEPEASDKGGA